MGGHGLKDGDHHGDKADDCPHKCHRREAEHPWLRLGDSDPTNRGRNQQQCKQHHAGARRAAYGHHAAVELADRTIGHWRRPGVCGLTAGYGPASFSGMTLTKFVECGFIEDGVGHIPHSKEWQRGKHT